ncbi:hypothetical protein NX722_25150 [Endozoicomonas gorgoniicola]|uniref:Uncharacterized protein n=1 Tax=Endozoicomonas gorgoniicola TaxID=1234144 RepID=A0ABT3N3S7_9GAMM|nr:hypothetical protein [Endozoicomonas gorgoniicola]MCW7555854.1 hypothetical protein [Endozoicomonas gorgoniicola]
MRKRIYLKFVILLFAVLNVCSSKAEVMAVFHESYRYDPAIEVVIDNYIKSAEVKGHKIIKVFVPTQTITELADSIHINLLSQDVALKDISGINFYGPVLSEKVTVNSTELSGYSLFRLQNIIYEPQASDDVLLVKSDHMFDIVRWVSHQSFKSNKELINHLNKSSKNIAPDNSVNLGIQHLKDLEENIYKCIPYFYGAYIQQRDDIRILYKGLSWLLFYATLSLPQLVEPNLSGFTKTAKDIARLCSLGAMSYYMLSFVPTYTDRLLKGNEINAEEFCRKFIIPVMNNDGLLKTFQKNDQF